MDLSKIPIFSGLAGRLDFLAARTRTIAQNIANADTPNYVARDLEQKDFAALARSASSTATALKTSSPRHIAAPSSAGSVVYREVRAPDGEASLTGNDVSLETQAMKLSATRQEYALAANIYRKGVEMLRLAARGQ
ncbi:MAG: flagellar basal body protein [Pseudomonadota bacterium]